MHFALCKSHSRSVAPKLRLNGAAACLMSKGDGENGERQREIATAQAECGLKINQAQSETARLRE